MSAKHTPGPWTLETVRTSCGTCHKIGDFPGKTDKANYACVYADNVYDHDIGHSAVGDELLANARLIAAAPDLLEALENLERVSGIAMMHDDPARTAARAAIAKAKGGAA